jgi:hypothetical protein
VPRDYDAPDWSLSVVPIVVAAALFVVYCVVLPAVAYVASLPRAVVRSRRSRTWIVEAVCWWPHEQRFRWSVDTSQCARVTAEVVAGIAEGRWAQPAGALFQGQVTR